MGFDLSNLNGKCMTFNIGSWGPSLKLAKENGWIPMGTFLHEEHVYYDLCGGSDEHLSDLEKSQKRNDAKDIVTRWDGGYFSNDGQIIQKEDANNIATALTKAVESHDWSSEPEWKDHLIDAITLFKDGPIRIS